MRTTINLPADLHRTAKALARDQGATLSETIEQLLRRALGQGGAIEVEQRNASTGLPSIRLGVTITPEDVRAMEDEP